MFGAGLFAAVLLGVFLTVLYARMGSMARIGPRGEFDTGPLSETAAEAATRAGPNSYDNPANFAVLRPLG